MQHPLIALANKDRLVEILKGKSFGVPKAILPFREPLGNECVWQVAIHTGGRRMMAGLLPGLVLRLHDVAMHAGRGVFTQIRKTFSIVKSEAAQSQQHSQTSGNDHAPCCHSQPITHAAS